MKFFVEAYCVFNIVNLYRATVNFLTVNIVTTACLIIVTPRCILYPYLIK